VYGTSAKLIGRFQVADLVLGGENKIAGFLKDGSYPPMTILIGRVRKYWKEYLSQEKWKAKLTPKIFKTEQEAINAGFTTQWDNSGPVGKGPEVSGAMDMHLLIKKPKDLICSLFWVLDGEDAYAPARWFIDKKAYTRVSSVLFPLAAQLRQQNKKSLLPLLFDLSVRLDNAKPEPYLREAGLTPKSLLDKLEPLFAKDPIQNTDSETQEFQE
jgi:hypothetical protein